MTDAAVPERMNLARMCLRDSARTRPDKIALIVAGSPEDSRAWSYGEIEAQVLRIAGGLRAAGLVPGERLFLRMENSADYAFLFFGAIAAGLVPVPASHQLTSIEARALIIDSGAHGVALSDTLPLHDVPPGIMVLSQDDLDLLGKATPLPDYHDSLADDPAFLVYTSGTGGRPKGVLHAQRSLWGRRPMYQGWYGIKSRDIVLHAGAFNWTYTLGAGLCDPWVNGATSVLYTGEKNVRIWPQLIARHKATIFATVPSLYRQILKYCTIDRQALSSLRHGLTAGEALPPHLAAEWQAATGTPLFEAFGMSELSTFISSSPSVPVRSGSPGRPQEGRKVAILPLSGGSTPLPAGETGLVAISRDDPGLMLGYWNRPGEESQVYRDNWFCGGDLAHMDVEGYVWLHGRADDQMNAMGYRVSPLEVERVLLEHDLVSEAGVCELPVREDVSVIGAFIVPVAGARLAPEEIKAFAAQKLAAYKPPRQIVFVDALPRTANGKIIRRALPRHFSS